MGGRNGKAPMLGTFFFGDEAVSAHSRDSMQGPSALVWLKYRKAPVLPTGCEAMITNFFVF